MLIVDAKAVLTWGMIVCFLVLSSCQSDDRKSDGTGSPNSENKAYATLPFGYVDGPVDGASLEKMASVTGWALSEDGISEVAIYVDRTYVTRATIGLSRPDVAKSMPQFQNNSNAGWEASIDLTNIGAGQHQLIVQARSKKGATADLAKLSIVVVR